MVNKQDKLGDWSYAIKSCQNRFDSAGFFVIEKN
ncbi:MAG: hypothetical protein ACI9UJ_001958, partial [bacterium]